MVEQPQQRGLIGEIKHWIFKDWYWPIKILWLSFVITGLLTFRLLDTFLFAAITYLFYDVAMMIVDEDREPLIDKI